VGSAVRALIRRIFESAPIRRAPPGKPDLARGKKLYQRSCAACHGAGATGDSPIAATMDPRPPDLLHPRQSSSPYDVFNRTTYGGASTAMPSFEDGLSEMQRWDIVFHLFAERWPPCDKPLPPLRADELALLGDYELSKRFVYGAAACLRRDFLPPAPPAARKGTR
jgi:high-affinity iron transporter